MPVGERTGTHFDLQFDPAEIPELANAYAYQNAGAEPAAFDAGQRITNGGYTRENVSAIIAWKSPRSLENLHVNAAEISDALWLAILARTDRAAITVLTGLEGVGVPIASAILTTMYVNRFTILDRRALESLGVEARTQYTVNFYLDYLDACREIARDHGVDLRTLDRALWQWSSNRHPEEE